MRRIHFLIHDLNTWGGQDRSTLEIARRISRRHPVSVHAFTLADPEFPEGWGGATRFHRILPNLKRPVIAKIPFYQLATLPWKLASARGDIFHSTGTSSVFSDFVQVQFVHSAWLHADGREKSAYHRALRRFNAVSEKLLYTKRRRYIAIAQTVRDELEAHFGVGEKTRVIHHGVDPKAFSPWTESSEGGRVRNELRASLGISPEDRVAVFVGAYERKGLETAIQAIARLAPGASSRVKLLAVGGGDIERYRRLAADLGISDRVVLVGHQKKILPYYWAGDFFLLPTRYEPFGLVILEAMSCGLAPLVSRLAGASELIEAGKSGLLLEDPTRADEIASRLTEILSGDNLNRIGVHARKVAESRSWDQVAIEYEDFLLSRPER